MYCKNCGKEVKGNFCANCGSSVNNGQHSSCATHHQPYTSEKEQKLNIMALIGFVVGCISIFLNFWGIVGIVALIFSVVGFVQINNSNEKGKGFAIAGMIMGGFSIIYGFIVLILLM